MYRYESHSKHSQVKLNNDKTKSANGKLGLNQNCGGIHVHSSRRQQ